MFLSLLAFDVENASHDDPHASAVAALRGALPRISAISCARLCVAGALKRIAGDGPNRACGALLLCDESEVAQSLADPSRAAALLEGTGVDAASLHIESIDATAEIPFAPDARGQLFFALAASFDYATGPGDARAAERHYLDYHVPRSRELPSLRAYFTGRIAPSGTSSAPRAPRQRMGVEVFESREALANAFRSPVGLELRKDGEYVCADVRLYHLDGTML